MKSKNSTALTSNISVTFAEISDCQNKQRIHTRYLVHILHQMNVSDESVFACKLCLFLPAADLARKMTVVNSAEYTAQRN